MHSFPWFSLKKLCKILLSINLRCKKKQGILPQNKQPTWILLEKLPSWPCRQRWQGEQSATKQWWGGGERRRRATSPWTARAGRRLGARGRQGGRGEVGQGERWQGEEEKWGGSLRGEASTSRRRTAWRWLVGRSVGLALFASPPSNPTSWTESRNPSFFPSTLSQLDLQPPCHRLHPPPPKSLGSHLC